MNKKVVLITGASKGIGAATALKFAEKGYDVVINYYQSQKSAQEIFNKTQEYGSDSLLYKADIKVEKEVNIMIDAVVSKYGKIDVLVNNAGIAFDSLIEDKTSDTFMKILSTNLIASFIVSRACAKYMPSGSSIIMVASTNGIDTYYPYSLDYDASKAGLISLMHNLSEIYAPNIRVNAVAPGWVMTDMNKELDAEYISDECDKILLGRFAQPEEIANVIYFLASDEARYINNEVIRVDGGTK